MSRDPVMFWDSVLRRARSDVTQAERVLADALAMLAEAEAVREALMAQRRQGPEVEAAAALHLDQGAWIGRLSASLRAAEGTIAAREMDADAAREALVEAKGMRSVAEKRLHEARRTAARKREERELNKMIDLAIISGRAQSAEA